MNHPHSDQRVHHTSQRRPAFLLHTRLVNAPVSPLDHRSSALTPTGHNDDSGLHPVIDGELVTSTLINPAPERGLLRRVVDDPYWALVTLMAALGLATTATAVYGIARITLGVAQWLHTNSGLIAIVMVVLALSAGATTAKCAGIHCPGCKH